MLVEIAPDDVEKCKHKHSANAEQNAEVFASHVLYFVDQFVTTLDVLVAQFNHLLIDAHHLLRLPRQVNLGRDGHIFCLLSLPCRTIQLVVLNQKLALLPAELLLIRGIHTVGESGAVTVASF